MPSLRRRSIVDNVKTLEQGGLFMELWEMKSDFINILFELLEAEHSIH